MWDFSLDAFVGNGFGDGRAFGEYSGVFGEKTALPALGVSGAYPSPGVRGLSDGVPGLELGMDCSGVAPRRGVGGLVDKILADSLNEA